MCTGPVENLSLIHISIVATAETVDRAPGTGTVELGGPDSFRNTRDGTEEEIHRTFQEASLISSKVISRSNVEKKDITEVLDNIVTSKALGVPLMLLLLGLVFVITLYLSNYPSDLLFSFFTLVEAWLSRALTYPVSYTHLDVYKRQLFRKRIGWLLVLFVAEALTGNIMKVYENVLSQVVALTFFIPLLTDTGGNSGSQASTLVIRAMALGEVTIKDFAKILWREIRVGAFLGLAMGTVGFFFSWFMGGSIGTVSYTHLTSS